ncbi:MAG: M20 family peptidase, partial [Chloroflexi bacterium]
KISQHLGEAVRYRTVSYSDPSQFDYEIFADYHQFLSRTYPNVHKQLAKEVINGYSLLYTWEGSDPSLDPYLLMGHIDVVPVEPGTESSWTYPPFEGCIEDGYIWGRGTLDCKATVLGILEAVESLLETGYKPRRTVYLAFGHDEEVSGLNGAKQIADYLQVKGVKLAYVLDEGLAVVEGVVSIVSRPIAMIGVAEKGYLSIELIAEVPGGHSSMPGKKNAIGVLSSALQRLERHPMPAHLRKPAQDMFRYLAPETSGLLRTILSNQGLFRPLLLKILSVSPAMNASVRTTIVPTIFHSGVKDNILPNQAKAVVNSRILPGDTIEDVVDHIKNVVSDPLVQVRLLEQFQANPSPVSDCDSHSFNILADTVRSVFPNAAVAPSLVVGATDSRHYVSLTSNGYRFSPLVLKKEDLSRIHGTNERISVENYEQAVKFYGDLILRSDTL